MFIDIEGLSDVQLAEAICDLYDRVYAEREAVAKSRLFPETIPGPVSSEDIEHVLNTSAVDKLAADAKEKPVATAAQWAVRCLAFQLLSQGGLNRMKDVCSEVGEINGRAENWLDHRWNGIGGWWS